MSTNATLSMRDGNQIRAIYLHLDGYPSMAGKTLIENYDTDEKVRKLIDLGSLSILDKKTEPDPDQTHDFEHYQDGVCLAYHRDRGEPLDIEVIPDPDSIPLTVLCDKLLDISGQYAYIWDNGKWNIVLDNGFADLAEYIKSRPRE